MKSWLIVHRHGLTKKIIIVIGIMCLGVSTACGNNNNPDTQFSISEMISKKPYNENMSQEEFERVTNDFIVYATDLGNAFSQMSFLTYKYADRIESSKMFNWSQYWDFRETKEEIILICDKILAYDDSVCSRAYQRCIDEWKSIAFQLKKYFNKIAENMDIHELDTLTQNIKNEFHVSMSNAQVYMLIATIDLLENNNGDKAVIEGIRQQISDSYIYKVTVGDVGLSMEEQGHKELPSIFTNSYGMPNTRCVHEGCDNTIASSGDTNCCIIHSSKCYNCGKYVDEDALFCMDCLSGKTYSLEGTGKYNSGDVSGNGCQYSYLDGSLCGNQTNKYASLCDEHFKLLNDTYNSLIGK